LASTIKADCSSDDSGPYIVDRPSQIQTKRSEEAILCIN